MDPAKRPGDPKRVNKEIAKPEPKVVPVDRNPEAKAAPKKTVADMVIAYERAQVMAGQVWGKWQAGRLRCVGFSRDHEVIPCPYEVETLGAFLSNSQKCFYCSQSAERWPEYVSGKIKYLQSQIDFWKYVERERMQKSWPSPAIRRPKGDEPKAPPADRALG